MHEIKSLQRRIGLLPFRRCLLMISWSFGPAGSLLLKLMLVSNTDQLVRETGQCDMHFGTGFCRYLLPVTYRLFYLILILLAAGTKRDM